MDIQSVLKYLFNTKFVIGNIVLNPGHQSMFDVPNITY